MHTVFNKLTPRSTSQIRACTFSRTNAMQGSARSNFRSELRKPGDNVNAATWRRYI